jgi:hypothetical protein
MSNTEQSWAERLGTNDCLRRFIDAEVARAHVDLQALRVDCAHWRAIAETQAIKLAKLQPATERVRQANVEQQRTWRQRNEQFFVPVIEEPA